MKFLLILLISLAPLVGFGQLTPEVFEKDLDFVYQNLKESTSYQTQKDNHPGFELKYRELKNQSSELSLIESYILLYELIDELDDFHNEIYGNTEEFSYEDLQDESFLKEVKTSAQYNFYPKTVMDLDSLELDLSKRELNEYEGIYHYLNYFKIALYQRPDGLMEGIVLETIIPSRDRGETIIYLLPKKNNHFRLFTGHLVNKSLLSSKDYFKAGEFKASKWKKKNDAPDFYDANFPDHKYVFKDLNKEFQYVKLGTFNSSNQGIEEATEFYNEISDKLTAKSLILDLRNNYGGGDKSSNQFYKLFKKYKGHIYILANYNTVSNAEQFIIKLKKRKNVTVLGDNTRGKVTYGHNYDEDKETPSQFFRIYFSDLKDNWRRYIPYEGPGIIPDVYLSNEEDWVEQTVEKYSN